MNFFEQIAQRPEGLQFLQRVNQMGFGGPNSALAYYLASR